MPQLGLQIWYLFSQTADVNLIVYAAMGFSTLSIIISIAALASQGHIIRNQDFVSIEFEITGNSIMTNKKKCKNRVKAIKNSIASLLGLDESLLEIIRPTTIKKGLKVRIYVYINHTKAIDMNIERDINKAQKSGEIASIVQTAWNLKEFPNITNVECIKHASLERQENTVVIGRMKKSNQMGLEVDQHSNLIGTEAGSGIGTQIKLSEQYGLEDKGRPNRKGDNIHAGGQPNEVEVGMVVMNEQIIDIHSKLPPEIPAVQTTPGFGKHNTENSESEVVQMVETTGGDYKD